MNRTRMAVIGVGHLGKAHARVLSAMPDVELVGVADVNAEQAHAVARMHDTQAFTSHLPLLEVADAATIVAPTTYHYEIASDFLRRGIPLMIEKPIAATVTEAKALVDLADRNNAILQVGHIERFNPAFEELTTRRFQPKFIQAERMGPFTGRSTDIGVVLDLMIHDLDLIVNLVGADVEHVDALGVSVFGGNEDIANARITFSSGCVAEITASRASPVPSRCMNIWSSEGYLQVDYSKRHLTLIQPTAHLRRSGINPASLDARSFGRLREELFDRHFETLHLDCNNGDQLTQELQHFVDCVATGTQPRVTGHDGLKALRIAHLALDSIRNHRWDQHPNTPTGPNHLPMPLGPLFRPTRGEAAA